MENRKIISIEVENLFNIYNHKINLKDGGITIIYGPNGVGKTILLSMVHAFFSKNFSLFEKIPFTSFTISTTRETIIIYRHQNYLECLIGNKSTKIKFIDEGLSRIAKRIERRIPFLEQIADDSWLDLRTDESVFGNFSFYSYKKACGQKKTVRGSKNSRRLSNGTPAI